MVASMNEASSMEFVQDGLNLYNRDSAEAGERAVVSSFMEAFKKRTDCTTAPKKVNKGRHTSSQNKKKARRRQNEHNMLLHRFSSPQSRPLLERIGGSDRIDGCSFYTPDAVEVELFLQSVIGAPLSSSPSGSGHACSGEVKVEDTSPSVLSSPASHCLPLTQSPLMADRTRAPSPATLEACKDLLAPVLVASIQARDPGECPDPAQCLHLLSDDLCNDLVQKANETRRQLTSLLPQEAPAHRGSLKRDRVHEVDAWVRNTRTRFSSANTTLSDMPRRDSDITLVEAVPASRSPPKAPRAMLQAYQSHCWTSAQDPIFASSTVADPPASLPDLIHKTLQKFPCLKPPMTDPTPKEQLPVPPVRTPSPIPHPDFVSHLPTQPGTWFRQHGRRFAEIVDVDMDVSGDMFYLSAERQPSRVRMALRLCSVPVGATTPEALDEATARHTCAWPQKGKLVVQVNPEDERQKTWLPHTLTSDPLDVTSCVRPGKNVFRFIQLSDLSEFMFVLVASPSPPEEAWRSWDWASLASPQIRSEDNPLSEFAQIRVTVRS